LHHPPFSGFRVALLGITAASSLQGSCQGGFKADILCNISVMNYFQAPWPHPVHCPADLIFDKKNPWVREAVLKLTKDRLGSALTGSYPAGFM
jgi:hypothetical protein